MLPFQGCRTVGDGLSFQGFSALATSPRFPLEPNAVLEQHFKSSRGEVMVVREGLADFQAAHDGE
jgi:hypothetical protein